jgi:hypothetical protein
MPKLAKPLTDTQVKSAKPKDKPYTLAVTVPDPLPELVPV